MSMKLGEILVEKGIIDEDQLRKTLDAQLIYGAHLGTCLIELGYIDEDRLGHVLSEVLRVRFAERSLLEQIPPNVIGTLPAAAVEKHKAIPFDRKEKTLHVAMVDPRNLEALDELRFASSHRIEPWVSPEVRIFQAMERYYDIPRRQRYIALCHRLDRKAAASTSPASVTPVSVAPAPAPASASRRAPAAALAATASSPTSTGRLVPLEPPSEPAAAEPARATRTKVRPARPSRPPSGLEGASEALCRAISTEELAQAVLDFAVKELPRCILFRVKDASALLWGDRGIGLPETVRASLGIQVTEESLFRLMTGEGRYQGPMPLDPAARSFFEKMGIQPPTDLLLLPVYTGDRLAAIFYGDAGPAGRMKIDGRLYDRLMQKLSLGLALLSLQKKLRDV